MTPRNANMKPPQNRPGLLVFMQRFLGAKSCVDGGDAISIGGKNLGRLSEVGTGPL
jgi:hypothetical protein